ncbi:MAG: hypothetical protein KIT09_13960 [Bryobacteraceae bacterium]|nr:hypothetical protein [Bryobacteraceae bacterium]
MKRCIAKRILYGSAVLAFCASWSGAAQEPEPAPSSGWRRVDEPRDPSAGPASELLLPAGAWITVRVNDPVSSDHSRPGDVFTATLEKPVVVQGFVIARRGQTVEGRVVEAHKAGRLRGTSRLGLELTEIGLVDGQQFPMRTELIQYAGGTSLGRDATAVATTSGLGAAIGAAADGGFGAGMGAIAGAAASTLGVLVTRGRSTVVFPEATLTFRTVAPLVIDTSRAAHAFQPVTQGDYEPSRRLERRAMAPPTLYPPFYYSDLFWSHSPFFYGPGIFWHSRPAHFYGRGFHRRRW